MTGTGIEIEIVKTLQLLNTLERGWAERRLPVESVKNDAFQEVAQRHVVILGESLQDFEQAFLHPDAGLNALDKQFGVFRHVY